MTVYLSSELRGLFRRILWLKSHPTHKSVKAKIVANRVREEGKGAKGDSKRGRVHSRKGKGAKGDGFILVDDRSRADAMAIQGCSETSLVLSRSGLGLFTCQIL